MNDVLAYALVAAIVLLIIIAVGHGIAGWHA
jgi:hypothetical protein